MTRAGTQLPATVETDRLVLSRIAQADTEDLIGLLLNGELYTYIDRDVDTVDDARQRIERWVRGSLDPSMLWVNYVARARTDRRLVGLAQATVFLDEDGAVGECTLAYLVSPAEQRQGFGAEMMTGFWSELRGSLEPAVVSAHIYPGHAASEGVARTLGLSRTDELVDGESVWKATL